MIWAAKILAKIVMSRMPVAYSKWRDLGAFRHGRMHTPDYAISVVSMHIDRLGGSPRLKGSVCMELGPGDSLASALIAHAYGALRTILVDVGDFANKDMETYQAIADTLRKKGLGVPDISRCTDASEMLEILGGQYLTNGLDSLREVASSSIDCIWSQAVLEHVRRQDLLSTFKELRRTLKRDGNMSHRIDFKDHLASSINNLRFPRSIWETDFFANSGFYTNRVRKSEMCQFMEESGFSLKIEHVDKWLMLPLPRRKLAKEFRFMSDDDLLTSGIDIIAG